MRMNWNLWNVINFEGEGSGGGAGAAALSGDPGASGKSWFGNITDTVVTGHLTQKGWDKAATLEEGVTALVKGHMSAEQMIGKQGPARPGKDATDADWKDYYGKVRGVNNTAEYKLDFKEGQMDKNLYDAGLNWFFENGLDSRQAKGVFDAWNKYNEDALVSFIKQSDTDMQELAKEIPVNQFDDWVEHARRAADFAMKEAGFNKDTLAQVERVLGTKVLMKMFNKFGQMFKEGVAPGGGSSHFEQTPEFAKAEIAKLRADPEFMKAYTSDNPAIRQPAIEKMLALQKLVHGDKPIQ